jgi:hypothetical protein
LLTGLSGIRIKVYTYKELKIASDNFSPANKIGEGGFGSVYKVTKQLQVFLSSLYHLFLSLFFPFHALAMKP